MAIAQSKVTAQGQISVPVEVRRRLGVGPGSILEWEADGEQIVVRRAGRFSFEEIHAKVFAGGKAPGHGVEEMREGIRRYVRKRHARS